MIDYIFCSSKWWIKLLQSFTLSFILEVFQDSIFANLPDKNLDYLVAEGIAKKVNYRYMCLKLLAATKATIIKKSELKNFFLFVLDLPALKWRCSGNGYK